MIEYSTVDVPIKRITIISEFVEAITESGNTGQHTIVMMSSGKTHIVDAPYETVRIHLGQALGCDLADEEFESENDFLGDTPV